MLNNTNIATLIVHPARGFHFHVDQSDVQCPITNACAVFKFLNRLYFAGSVNFEEKKYSKKIFEWNHNYCRAHFFSISLLLFLFSNHSIYSAICIHLSVLKKNIYIEKSNAKIINLNRHINPRQGPTLAHITRGETDRDAETNELDLASLQVYRRH